MERLPRGTQAKQRTQLWRGKQEGLSLFFGGGLGVLGLALFASPEMGTVTEAAIVAGAAILSVPLRIGVEYTWHYARAPTHELRANVRAIREHLAQTAVRTPDQEAADQAAREALARIRGELEDIYERLSEVLAAESWWGAIPSMGHWVRWNADVARAGFTGVHEAGRRARGWKA